MKFSRYYATRTSTEMAADLAAIGGAILVREILIEDLQKYIDDLEATFRRYADTAEVRP
jgi:hypothetical protein